MVPNKFPALEIEGELNKRGEGIYDMMRGVGAHEVIIESPEHLLSTADLAEENLREVTMFPMNQQAQDLMMNAPSDVSQKQLRELHIRTVLPENA